MTDLSALFPSLYHGNKVVTGTTYTVLAEDNGMNLIFTNGSAIAVTLPDTLLLDFQFSAIQAGVGVPTITRSGSDTINGAATGVTPSAQWKAIYLTQFLDTEWAAVG